MLKVPVSLEDAERALHFAYQEQKEAKEGNKGKLLPFARPLASTIHGFTPTLTVYP